ncbi:MAG: helix-turn-helix domain-containing protein [Pseudonocardia sp.]|nr:helix-turn-helix domain-containing protein [Pseudonocardia sp.]
MVDTAVASLVEGYTEARRQLVRWEETLRREFIEDLLRGDADVGRLVERAEPFGLDLARPHQVALAAPTGRLDGAESAISSLEHAVVRRMGDRDVLVATKDGWIVVIAPADREGLTGVTTEAARRLHLSVRAVAYRLDRIKTLTGSDPTNPAQRFTLQAAVLGARLPGWPGHDLR